MPGFFSGKRGQWAERVVGLRDQAEKLMVDHLDNYLHAAYGTSFESERNGARLLFCPSFDDSGLLKTRVRTGLFKVRHLYTPREVAVVLKEASRAFQRVERASRPEPTIDNLATALAMLRGSATFCEALFGRAPEAVDYDLLLSCLSEAEVELGNHPLAGQLRTALRVARRQSAVSSMENRVRVLQQGITPAIEILQASLGD